MKYKKSPPQHPNQIAKTIISAEFQETRTTKSSKKLWLRKQNIPSKKENWWNKKHKKFTSHWFCSSVSAPWQNASTAASLPSDHSRLSLRPSRSTALQNSQKPNINPKVSEGKRARKVATFSGSPLSHPKVIIFLVLIEAHAESRPRLHDPLPIVCRRVLPVKFHKAQQQKKWIMQKNSI